MEIEQSKIDAYKQVIYPNSPVFEAYYELMHFVRRLKTDLEKAQTDYKVGNLSEGYLDYTYFPFFDEKLRSKKLRYGIVLNHQSLQFELWLMGQNKKEQLFFWEKLKNTSWNQEQQEMYQYSVLEVVISKNPDFSDLDKLSEKILTSVLEEVKEISKYL